MSCTKSNGVSDFWRVKFGDEVFYTISSEFISAVQHWVQDDLDETTRNALLLAVDEDDMGGVMRKCLDEFAGERTLKECVDDLKAQFVGGIVMAAPSKEEARPSSLEPTLVWVDDRMENNVVEIDYAESLGIRVIELPSTTTAKLWVEKNEDELRSLESQGLLQFITDNTRWETSRIDSRGAGLGALSMDTSAGEAILRFLRERGFMAPVLVYCGPLSRHLALVKIHICLVALMFSAWHLTIGFDSTSYALRPTPMGSTHDMPIAEAIDAIIGIVASAQSILAWYQQPNSPPKDEIQHLEQTVYLLCYVLAPLRDDLMSSFPSYPILNHPTNLDLSRKLAYDDHSLVRLLFQLDPILRKTQKHLGKWSRPPLTLEIVRFFHPEVVVEMLREDERALLGWIEMFESTLQASGRTFGEGRSSSSSGSGTKGSGSKGIRTYWWSTEGSVGGEEEDDGRRRSEGLSGEKRGSSVLKDNDASEFWKRHFGDNVFAPSALFISAIKTWIQQDLDEGTCNALLLAVDTHDVGGVNRMDLCAFADNKTLRDCMVCLRAQRFGWTEVMGGYRCESPDPSQSQSQSQSQLRVVSAGSASPSQVEDDHRPIGMYGGLYSFAPSYTV
ncbi:hypothetical protein AX17_003814 [Amanita inopinata Kibby_2008]|nr:hypothetical protein AX17_003814 [Amanita inopinata Kibby_2008]